MGYSREGITVFVQDKLARKVRSTFSLFNPVFYFLGIGKPDIKSGLGRPKAGAVFGGLKMGKAEMMETLGSFNHQFPFVKAEPNDGASIENGGQTPTASSNAEENFGTAESRWVHFREPWQVSKHSVEAARGETKMRALIEVATKPVQDRFFKRISSSLWTGTLTSAQQDARVWSNFIGFQAGGTVNNVWNRVDRSVETHLNPLAINASTQLPTRVIDLDLCRKVNVGFTDELSADITGLATKEETGQGATLWVTTPALWQTLASQADGRYQIHVNGIPNSGLGGFRQPIIQYGNCFYAWDPFCPTGEMHGFCLSEWVVEIEPGHNFAATPVVDKAATEQGGEYILWGAYDVKMRVTNRAPDLHCRIYNLQTE